MIRILGTWDDLVDDATQINLSDLSDGYNDDPINTEYRDVIRLFLPVGHALLGDEFVGIGITDDGVDAAKATVVKAVAEATEHLPHIIQKHRTT